MPYKFRSLTCCRGVLPGVHAQAQKYFESNWAIDLEERPTEYTTPCVQVFAQAHCASLAIYAPVAGWPQ